MTKTVTAAYDSAAKARNAEDDLISAGIEREKIYVDKGTNEVKVMVPETIEPEITEILNRHGPTQAV